MKRVIGILLGLALLAGAGLTQAGRGGGGGHGGGGHAGGGVGGHPGMSGGHMGGQRFTTGPMHFNHRPRAFHGWACRHQTTRRSPSTSRRRPAGLSPSAG